MNKPIKHKIKQKTKKTTMKLTKTNSGWENM